MRTATARTSVLALLALLVALPAQAQDPDSSDVTFTVDMSALIETCIFNPDSEEAAVTIPGSFPNADWSTTADPLSDEDDDRVYQITKRLPQGETYLFKYFGVFENSSLQGWEANPEDSENREYTVTEDEEQTYDGGAFNPQFAVEDQCGVETVEKELVIEFAVNMQAQLLSGNFDPVGTDGEPGDIVTVAGTVNGWITTADTLQRSVIDDNIWSKVVRQTVEVPVDAGYSVEYKFVTGTGVAGEAPAGWESGDNRAVVVSPSDDLNDDGLIVVAPENRANREVELPIPYFNNVPPDGFFGEETTVTLEVDLRPAFYYHRDNGTLPGDNEIASIDGVFVNGPLAGRATATTDTDWIEPWNDTAEGLGSATARQLVDDGTGGDAVANDSIYTVQYVYPGSAPRRLVGKFSVNGFDNEATAQVDHVVFFDEEVLGDDNRYRYVFGGITLADGAGYEDDCGPSSPAGLDDCVGGDYNPYITTDNDAEPPTVGVAPAGNAIEAGDPMPSDVEDLGGEQPQTATLRGAAPNPFSATTRIEFGLEESGHVRLAVYDVLGREVAVLVDEVLPASSYAQTLDANGLAAGMYVYVLKTATQTLSERVVLVK